MNILVTGSNGFVGRAIVENLKKNHYVIGIGTKGTPTNKVGKYVKWDIAKDELTESVISEKIDVIIHAAACIDIKDQVLELAKVNCLGTQRIFNLAVERNIKKVFYISSAPVIGVPEFHPISEKHPLKPLTMYHVTKLSGELILSQLYKYNIEAINLRIPSPIGPGMPVKSILPLFIRKVMSGEDITINGEGSRRQNYLDVRDLANVIENCLGKQQIAGAYLIAADTTISNIELARKCKDVIGGSSDIKYTGNSDTSDNQIWDYDNSNARDILGFYQKYSIDESIADIWKSMERNLKGL